MSYGVTPAVIAQRDRRWRDAPSGALKRFARNLPTTVNEKSRDTRWILRDYLKGANAPRSGGLLFPSARVKGNAMVTDFRKALDAVAERAGWKEGDIRSKAFRHTYCAARRAQRG